MEKESERNGGPAVKKGMQTKQKFFQLAGAGIEIEKLTQQNGKRWKEGKRTKAQSAKKHHQNV